MTIVHIVIIMDLLSQYMSYKKQELLTLLKL